MAKIIVSACLLGCDCRYKGDNCKNEALLALAAKYTLIPVCPEQLGGLATPRNPKFPVAFDNPGFEDGANGWDHFPTNAAIVSDVTHSGKRAARLTVNDPMTESVYITRKIPVRGGAFYQASVFLKTLDVTAAPGKRSSVGAGLIVEWSDKDGK